MMIYETAKNLYLSPDLAGDILLCPLKQLHHVLWDPKPGYARASCIALKALDVMVQAMTLPFSVPVCILKAISIPSVVVRNREVKSHCLGMTSFHMHGAMMQGPGGYSTNVHGTIGIPRDDYEEISVNVKQSAAKVDRLEEIRNRFESAIDDGTKKLLSCKSYSMSIDPVLEINADQPNSDLLFRFTFRYQF